MNLNAFKKSAGIVDQHLPKLCLRDTAGLQSGQYPTVDEGEVLLQVEPVAVLGGFPAVLESKVGSQIMTEQQLVRPA